MQHMGKRLKDLREGRGWTQVQLGVYAGVSHTTVSLAESGQRTPNAETIVKLARALNVEPGDLFAEPGQLVEDPVPPLAQAPPSPEPVEDPAAYEERRAREFLSRVPSEDQRIELIERGTEICRGYVGRWVSERQYIEKNGTLHYGKSIEMETLRDRLLAALENAGMAPYANWAIVKNPGVSSRERRACANLDDAMADMFAEIDRMRDVEQANRRSADESVPAGIKALEEELALQPRGKQHG